MHQRQVNHACMRADRTDDARRYEDAKPVQLVRQPRTVWEHHALLFDPRQRDVRDDSKRHPS